MVRKTESPTSHDVSISPAILNRCPAWKSIVSPTAPIVSPSVERNCSAILPGTLSGTTCSITGGTFGAKQPETATTISNFVQYRTQPPFQIRMFPSRLRGRGAAKSSSIIDYRPERTALEYFKMDPPAPRRDTCRPVTKLHIRIIIPCGCCHQHLTATCGPDTRRNFPFKNSQVCRVRGKTNKTHCFCTAIYSDVETSCGSRNACRFYQTRHTNKPPQHAKCNQQCTHRPPP